ncbi:MAG TPA: hypothetical protein VGJ66_13860 [Pyrinomonadaceae bacterium]|jgi:hypothetical protein
MTDSKERESPGTSQTDEDELETEIDETLEDTFPASDPPFWTLGTDHRVESPDDVAEDIQE